MKDHPLFRDIKKLLSAGLVLALAVNIAACSSSASSSSETSVLSTLDTTIEQSAATSVMLETVSTETTVVATATPTPTATPVPTLHPEDRTVTVTFTGDCTLTQDYRSSNRQFDSLVGDNMEYCFKNCADLFKSDDIGADSI